MFDECTAKFYVCSIFDYSYFTMEFNDLQSALHMSLLEAGYGSGDGQSGSEISGAVSGVTTPGASSLQDSQLQERSATTQGLQEGAHERPGCSGLWKPKPGAAPQLPPAAASTAPASSSSAPQKTEGLRRRCSRPCRKPRQPPRPEETSLDAWFGAQVALGLVMIPTSD